MVNSNWNFVEINRNICLWHWLVLRTNVVILLLLKSRLIFLTCESGLFQMYFQVLFYFLLLYFDICNRVSSTLKQKGGKSIKIYYPLCQRAERVKEILSDCWSQNIGYVNKKLGYSNLLLEHWFALEIFWVHKTNGFYTQTFAVLTTKYTNDSFKTE